MSVIEGGQRDRLIAHSFHYLVRFILDSQGWFDAGRRHLPVTLIDYDPGDAPTEVPAFNTLAVFDESFAAGAEVELGSSLTTDPATFYCDFYAADDSIGRDLTGDLRDGLSGKMSAIGRTIPILSVLDFRMATPAEVFTCWITDVLRDRGHDDTQAWRRHWWTVRATVEDVR